MTKNIVVAPENDFDGDGEDFKTLTPQEAGLLKQKMPLLSVWKVVGYQILVGAVVVVLTAWITGSYSVALSAGYGALAVILPAAVFARGMSRRVDAVNAGVAVFGFLFWELIKIALTVAMLVAANWWVKDLSWLAMLVGLVVTMKVYWIALGFNSVFYSKTKLA